MKKFIRFILSIFYGIFLFIIQFLTVYFAEQSCELLFEALQRFLTSLGYIPTYARASVMVLVCVSNLIMPAIVLFEKNEMETNIKINFHFSIISWFLAYLIAVLFAKSFAQNTNIDLSITYFWSLSLLTYLLFLQVSYFLMVYFIYKKDPYIAGIINATILTIYIFSVLVVISVVILSKALLYM